MSEVRKILGVFLSLCTLLILMVGCMPHGTDSTLAAGPGNEETVEEMAERQAPPFFVFRSGADPTIADD